MDSLNRQRTLSAKAALAALAALDARWLCGGDCVRGQVFHLQRRGASQNFRAEEEVLGREDWSTDSRVNPSSSSWSVAFARPVSMGWVFPRTPGPTWLQQRAFCTVISGVNIMISCSVMWAHSAVLTDREDLRAQAGNVDGEGL